MTNVPVSSPLTLKCMYQQIERQCIDGVREVPLLKQAVYHPV